MTTPNLMKEVVPNKIVSSPLEFIEFYSEVNAKTNLPRYKHVAPERMVQILNYVKMKANRAEIKNRAMEIILELKE